MSTANRALSLSKFDWRETVNILAGPEDDQETFLLHRDLLCSRSDLFRAAIIGDWKEAQEKVVRLPEVNNKLFRVYVGCLYTGTVDLECAGVEVVHTDVKDEANNVFSVEDQDGADDIPTKEAVEHRAMLLYNVATNAFALGERLQDRIFRNAVMSKTAGKTGSILSNTNCFPGVDATINMAGKVSRGSPMLKFYVDAWAVDREAAHFREIGGLLPQDFVLEVACAGIEERRIHYEDRDPRYRPRCFYHEHETDADKCT
ncbi:uncharacterized protein LTR77_010147 [Saxophila tyrrhenica]|uniref:BTB domain-containing protein n=1 Tax=Saxophila tyrrhenica TaxID=1690608 RepID=A0AAV9NVY7_9PEZI|nr:hypothetical protein LTR77_010147 [Saxophila tyrrhenica]